MKLPVRSIVVKSGIAMLLMIITRNAIAQDSLQKDGYHRFYYPNGVLSSEGTLRGGKPDGYWKAYFENGKIKSEGNRLNFELDSVWRFYGAEEKPVVEITYKAGKKNGIKTTWLDKETVKEEYRDDIKEGFTRNYYPDGKPKQEIPFVKGLEQGFGKEFATDGTIVTLTEYKKGFIVDRQRINRKDSQGRKQGRWYTFYDRGSIKTDAVYRDDKKNGYYKEYAENGDLLRISKYTDDVVEPEAAEVQKLDVQNEYYPDGQLKISAMFRNGVPEGIRREYAPNGTVEKSVLYRNGVVTGEGIILDDGNRNGPWKDYYPDGTLKAEGNYENGKQTGEWKYYHSNGKIEQAGRYNKLGKPDGTWKWYFDNGQLLKEESYLKGEKDGLSTEYDETGKVITEGEFINGNEEGPWFEQTGDNYIRGTYRDGLRNGMWYCYFLDRHAEKTDSLCYFKGNFIDDNPDGKHTWYWENGKVRNEGSFLNGKKEGEWYTYNSDGTLFLTITYRQGVETRFDGIRIKPPFEKEED